MKSITKKINLLLLLSVALFMSSCLDSGPSSYIGNNEYSYIANEGGVMYARTFYGYLITSPKINTLTPGTTALITYQVTEDSETVTVGEDLTIFKADLGGEPHKLDQTELQPEPTTPYEIETLPFVSFNLPSTYITNRSEYFGYCWPIVYQYKAEKEQRVNIGFYKVDEVNLPENFDADILVDVRIEMFNTPAEKEAENKEEIIVVDMSSLKGAPTNKEKPEFKDLKVKFRYYLNVKDSEPKLHTSESITMRVPK